MNIDIDSVPGALESIAALLARLKGLLESRKRGRRDIFDEVVSPIYQSLKTVVDDYYEILARSRELVLASRQAALTEALTEIRLLRERRRTLREELEAFMRIAAERVHDRDFNKFLECVEAVLLPPGYRLEHDTMSRSRTGDLVRFWEYVEKDNVDKDLLIEFIDAVRRDLREQWAKAASAHARLYFDFHLASRAANTIAAQDG